MSQYLRAKTGESLNSVFEEAVALHLLKGKQPLGSPIN